MTETWNVNKPLITNVVSEDLSDINENFTYLMARNGYVVDSTEADQGSAGGGNSVKDLVDAIGATKKATLFFPHLAIDGDTTTYVFGTSETIPSNIHIDIQPGAIIQPAEGVTLTVHGPENIIAPPRQQIISTANNSIDPLAFTDTGTVFPGWLGFNTTPGTTDMTLEINLIITAAAAGSIIDLNSQAHLISDGVLASKALTFRNGTIKAANGISQTDDSDTNAQYMMVYVTAANVEFYNITFDGVSEVTNAIVPVWSEAANTVVQNCIFKNLIYTGATIGTGVLLRGPSGYSRVENCHFSNVNSGATTQGGNGVIFAHNTFISYTSGAAHDTPFGVDGGTGVRVIGNVIMCAAGSPASGSYFGVTGPAKRTIVEGNTISGFRGGVGIYVWDGYGVATPEDTLIANNIIDGNDFVEVGTNAMIKVEDNALRTIIQGNILTNGATGGGSSIAMDIQATDTIIKGNTIRSDGAEHQGAIVVRPGGGTIDISENSIDTPSRCVYLLSAATTNAEKIATIRNNRFSRAAQGINWTGASQFPLRLENNQFDTILSNPVVGTKWDRGFLAGSGVWYPHRVSSGVNGSTTMTAEEVPSSSWGGSWRKGDIIWNRGVAASGTLMWVCTTSGTFGSATDSTGDTDGSTAVITGLTDTSDFTVGDWIDVSAGFPTTGPYQAIAITSTTITLDTNSDSVQSNITVDNSDPTFTVVTAS